MDDQLIPSLSYSNWDREREYELVSVCDVAGKTSRVWVYLFELEDVLIEVLLQLLVGEVDAELLEAVHHEVLKAEDVQHSNERRLALGLTSDSLYSIRDRVTCTQSNDAEASQATVERERERPC
jgi:hypothetical protein